MAQRPERPRHKPRSGPHPARPERPARAQPPSKPPAKPVPTSRPAAKPLQKDRKPSPPATPGQSVPLKRGVRLVHEDDAILVLDKPPGMAVALEPGQRKGKLTVLDLAIDHVREIGGRTRPKPVHWPDPESSGLVVFAKTDASAEALRGQWRTTSPTRIAVAMVKGRPRSGATGVGTVQSELSEDARGRVMLAASRVPSKRPARVRPAVTHYRVLATGPATSLLELRLETDHRDQARLHMRELGCPIMGDEIRRVDRPVRPPRFMLHLSEVGFTHPSSKQSVRYSSPPPPAWRAQVEGRDVDAGERPAPEGAKVTPDPSWEHVSGWYSQLVGGGKSSFHDSLIIPGVLRLLDLPPQARVLDVACGEGSLSRALAQAGIRSLGVDLAPSLIETAQAAAPPAASFVVGDARNLEPLKLGQFDGATCVMAVMNLDPIGPVFRGIADALVPGGRFVIVMLHPAFRAPGQTSWGWADGERGVEQYRRIDAYLSRRAASITMNPGGVAKGEPPVSTTTYHRSIGEYISALARSGFMIDALEEWASPRVSEPGPRAEEENRARREIPMFLALRAIKAEAQAAPPSA